MLLISISHIVCKFQKDWMKNRKNAKFGDGPLKDTLGPLHTALRTSRYVTRLCVTTHCVTQRNVAL